MNVTVGTPEVRVTNTPLFVTAERHFFFDGLGHRRQFINDGQPDILNARARSNRGVAGSLYGKVKVMPIKGAPGWLSLREVSNKGNHRTVYLHATAKVVVDGEEAALGTFYTRNGGPTF